jgi:hypothetical protein
MKKAIKENNAHYALFMGGRDIGKSYQVKHDIVGECFMNGTHFIYLRREDTDLKEDLLQRYFGDCRVSDLTEGQFDEIIVYRKTFYLARRNELGQIEEKQVIGFAHALSLASHYKSTDWSDVDRIVYEEFIPDGKPYLQNEPDALQEYVSTIARDRHILVYLVGNTISKICPYYTAWDLKGITRMKKGQIDLYRQITTLVDEEGTHEREVRILVEKCKATGLFSQMAFGASAEHIAKNDYKTSRMPRVSVEYLRLFCDKCYEMYWIYQNLTFKSEFYRNEKGEYFWYVKPADGAVTLEKLGGIRCITDQVDYSIYHTDFRALSPKENRVLNYFSMGKIFFSDDSTGTDFRVAYRELMRRRG